MTGTEVPVGYLPPQQSRDLRRILSAVTDTGLRADLTAWGEDCFAAGHAYGYDRGFGDAVAERDAVDRSRTLPPIAAELTREYGTQDPPTVPPVPAVTGRDAAMLGLPPAPGGASGGDR